MYLLARGQKLGSETAEKTKLAGAWEFFLWVYVVLMVVFISGRETAAFPFVVLALTTVLGVWWSIGVFFVRSFSPQVYDQGDYFSLCLASNKKQIVYRIVVAHESPTVAH